jgi:hypothetical protein
VLDARLPPPAGRVPELEAAGRPIERRRFFLVRVERALDTNDPQDAAIRNDGNYSFPVSHVIAAWGDEANLGYHGANRAHSGIRWHSEGESESDRFAAYMQAHADDHLFVAASNHSVLLNETEYAYCCFRSDDLASAGIDMTGAGVTIVGFERVLTTRGTCITSSCTRFPKT